MGLFKKKEDKDTIPKLPELPKLPTLPTSFKNDYDFESDSFPIKEFPSMNNYAKEIHELPSFPTNSFSEKFSQNSIKSAITGREFEEDIEEIDESDMEEFSKTIVPLPKKQIPLIKKQTEEKIIGMRNLQRVIPEEPIFIRIDKFEESLKIFNHVKEKISDIEYLLNETKQIKEKENEELSSWQEEVQKLKTQIERIDKDIFSKIA